ncbi:Binding-protein-dependent transport systems inner membrane component [Cupriavidus taiwanensis]|uniref:ABC transporter permease n=1 Tax=Cupriavidus taiwanensis TaxID=164546 RepID=UPI000E192FE4|nr:ABC transporter permease [Cupriavidus taiwanensis]SPA32519.1 Binding-protein-dependent transport systems inner membrane component [Cupriavidus taiwanensis]
MRLSPKLYLFSVAWLVLVAGATLLADWLPLRDPMRLHLADMLATPDATRWFGADSLGRDVLARTLYGFRITAVVSLGSVTLALLVGGTLGVCAGYFRGWVERAILMLSNVMLAFPPLVLVIAMVAYPGPPLVKVVVALGIVFVPAVIRIARANTLRLGEQQFVTAARAAGMGHARLIVRELLPNLVPALLAYSLLLVAIGALAEAALSFLGLGVPPPAPSLGSMMASEQSRVVEGPHAVFFPAGMLFLTIFALNQVGEELQRRLDGRARAA